MSDATSPAGRRWTLLLVCSAVFMLLLDVTVVTVALPEIRADLDASFAEVQWVIDAYTLALATVLLAAASLGDLRGRRRVFLGGTALFTFASALCALAPSAIALDLARAVQGLGGAAMLATALPLIGAAFPGPERAGAIGAFAATIGAAVAIGPLVGGAITEVASWHWIFIVNLPVGAAVLVLGSRRLAESADPRGQRIDLSGMALLSVGLFGLVFAIVRGNGEGWTSPSIVVALVAGFAFLVAFVVVESRVAQPMVDLRLFAIKAFSAATLAVLALGAGLFGLFLVLSIYLATALDQGSLTVGLQFLPLTFVTFVAAGVAGRQLAHRVPPILMLGGGLALVTVGLLLMTRVDATSGWTVLIPGFVIAGLGSGLINPSAATLSLAAVEPARAGVASGIVNLARQLGVAFGIAGLGAVFEASLRADVGETAGTALAAGAVVPQVADQARAALASGLDTAALVGAGITLVGAVVVVALTVRAPAPSTPRGPVAAEA